MRKPIIAGNWKMNKNIKEALEFVKEVGARADRDDVEAVICAPFLQLKDLKEAGKIELPYVPEYCEHNAHMFYIKAKDLEERSALISYLKENGVTAVFHYIPLHTAPAGKEYGRFHGEDKYTTKESERIIRLPMYYELDEQDAKKVMDLIHTFYK